MTFDELLEFVEHRMTMSHVYQPLLIRTLVDADGSATLRQLALAVLGESEPSISLDSSASLFCVELSGGWVVFGQ